ncbi:hypothetical protein L4C31_23155, partial [Aliivibrio sifiae]
RMLDIFEHMIAREIPENVGYMAYPTTSSGHPIHIHSMTQQYWHVIEQSDRKLSQRDFAEALYSNCDYPIPKKVKFVWHIEGLDLGVLETKTGHFFVYRYGHI